MLSGVSVVCFAASYGVALALEVSRLVLRMSARTAISLGFSVAGVFAHTVYLYLLGASERASGRLLLSSWYDWVLIAAWVVAVAYLLLAIRQPRNTFGIFMIPLVLVLVGLAQLLPSESFPAREAAQYWGLLHGTTLLLGTVCMFVGFAAAMMYLVQSYRLKHNLPPRQGMRLPSLERLERLNSRSLLMASALLAGGVVSGILLNLVAQPDAAVGWTDPAVLASLLMLAWLLTSVVFESVYRPARHGRKVAYLTLASFLVLGVVLGVVIFSPSEHASARSTSAAVLYLVGGG